MINRGKQSVSQDCVTPLERQRFVRDVTRLHRLGPRPIGELILEIIAEWPAARRIEFFDRLARYAAGVRE